MSEIKNTLDQTLQEEEISELEDTNSVRNCLNETERRMFKNEQSISELWNNFKQPKISKNGVPKMSLGQKHVKK